MAYECRRVVTGHTADGRSTVLYDSPMPLLGMNAGAGARQEDRAGVAARVMWSTRGFPVDNDDSSDAAALKVNTTQDDGTVFRIIEYAPGVAPRNHRTNSVDYAVVLSGSIEMELDSGTVQLNAGDVVVQRGTTHNWVNNGSEPCVIAFILIAARPVAIKGSPLPAEG